MDVPELRRLFNIKRSDFWIAIAAVAGVVLAGVLAGVLIGVILSLFWLLRVVTSPPCCRLVGRPARMSFEIWRTIRTTNRFPASLRFGSKERSFLSRPTPWRIGSIISCRRRSRPFRSSSLTARA